MTQATAATPAPAKPKRFVYAVVQHIEGHAPKIRLVRAKGKRSAIKHCAETAFSAKMASQDDLLNALEAKVAVEDAKD